MKKKRRVKFICCLMLCTSLFLAACGRDAISDHDAISDEGSASDITPAARKQGWVYVPEVITVGDERADYERMQPVGDAFCYVSREEGLGNGIKSICRYSLTDGGLQRVTVNWPEGGNDWDAGFCFFAEDKSLYMTANVYPASGSMKRFLCRFDLEGNCLFSRDITERAGRNVSVHGLTADCRGRLYIFLDSGEILLYAGDGDYHGSVSCHSPENREAVRVKGVCEGADGRVYFCLCRENRNVAGEDQEGTAGVRCSLMGIDFENAGLLETAGNLPNINGLCTGTRRGGEFAGENGDSPDRNGGSAEGSEDSDGGYDLLLYDEKAVYGYRFDTRESDSGSLGEVLFRWTDSDINGYCVTNLYLLEDGRLCATVADWLNDDRGIVALERTKAEQAPRREELVLVTVDGGSDLAAAAVKFNRGNSQYHLTVKNYGSLTDLYNAILTKEPVDLIDLSGLNVRRLADRGLLEDLTSYVERSEVFDRSDFVDGILDVYTCDHVLTGIPAEFMIRTVVGNGALLDNKAGLTLEELYSLADRYPGAKAFDGVTKEEMLQYLMMFHEDVFIDRDTGTCHFDSEEFKTLLGYVGQFPDSAVSGREEESLSAKMKKGEVLFAIEGTYLYTWWDFTRIFGEDAACVGFPTADGRGGHLLISSDAYAIASVSEHKESAWKFIEDSLTREKSELYAEIWLTYPTLKKTLEERIKIVMDRDDRLTWDDFNVALKLVPDAVPSYSVEDDVIIRIISEEAGAYYSGQKRIEDVVSTIQNRVQLYVNENM